MLSFFLVLFCPNRENSNHIDKYSLLTESVEATISVSGYTARRNGYQWQTSYTGMDLAIDEQGLWVLWGSTGNSGKLYASTIDVYKNVITQTWTLHTGKHILHSPLLTPKQRRSGKFNNFPWFFWNKWMHRKIRVFLFGFLSWYSRKRTAAYKNTLLYIFDPVPPLTW